MTKLSYPKYRLARKMGRLQLILGWIVLIVNISSLAGLHTVLYNEDVCHHHYGVKDVSGRFDFKAMTEHNAKVLEKMQTLQLKLEYDALNMDKDEEQLGKSNVSKLKFKKYLEEEVVQPLYGARVALRHIQFPRPYPIKLSLWKTLNNKNIRWDSYKCRDFECLSSKNPNRGYTDCIECFEMEKEKLKWVNKSSVASSLADFLIKDCFWLSSQGRCGLLDGWIDMLLLDFILVDWDRCLRPGGLLWVDRFSCNGEDLDDCMYMFLQFRYKKHKWVVAPESKDEVHLSALLEKARRSV
ncbi:hypothetical protein Cgig2_015206 [Carnegiea gigantea]|uniref:Uncharacterized protein n=1 Tax=Carnegiea gigantea TaxID=171969 RepID=A0A9Q1KS25_9CARY|nr:hypothetical protein Cgig2_015206 [Carnegiea gigantea]